MSETSLISFTPVEQPEASKKNLGFFKLPSQFFDMRDGHIISQSRFETLAGITAHAITSYANKSLAGTCYVSLDRLSILLGKSQHTIQRDIEGLKDLNWLQVKKVPIACGRFKNEYHVSTPQTEREARPLTFSRELFFGGLWAFLTPKERLVLILLRVSAWFGGELVGYKKGEEFYTSPMGEEFHFGELFFVPEHYLDFEFWRDEHGIKIKDAEKALERLAALNLIWWDNAVSGEGGFVMRIYPAVPEDFPGWEEHLAKFNARLERAKEKAIPPTSQNVLKKFQTAKPAPKTEKPQKQKRREIPVLPSASKLLQ